MVKSGRWWTKTRGLPKDTYASWSTSLASHPGRQLRILAWAALVKGVCIGSPSALSYTDENGWTHFGWHQIVRGGWDSKTRRLAWELDDGTLGSIDVVEPGRLPELFRERVAASIMVEKFVPIVGSRGVMINGRRDLSEVDTPIHWHTTLTRGLSWQDEAVSAAVEDAVRAVRSEYDMG